jgi:hypothetical protein
MRKSGPRVNGINSKLRLTTILSTFGDECEAPVPTWTKVNTTEQFPVLDSGRRCDLVLKPFVVQNNSKLAMSGRT